MKFPRSLFVADMNERKYKIIARENIDQPQCVMQSTGDKPLEFKMAEDVEGSDCRRIIQVRNIMQQAGSVGKASSFIRGVSVSNFGQDTYYPECDLSWFYSVPADKYRDNT
jgi:hypothetical protein